ncbi:MAG: LysM peptidoglycan-binding domain-containing protein [Deltaproteobacteria bacterium]|nr:LysM peptidoglycan-binding domain-containing protein [Deltaproteobacteria bacterium]
MSRRVLYSLAFALTVLLGAVRGAWAGADPRVHVVTEDQSLSEIAQRYGVTLAALRRANELGRREPIRPGQKLLIPPRGDSGGDFTRRLHQARALSAAGAAAADAAPAEPRVHTVQRCQKLGSIAKRYRVSVAALRNANGLGARDKIRPGQRLVVPDPDDLDGTARRLASGAPEPQSPSGPPSAPGEEAAPKPPTSDAPRAAPAPGTKLAASWKRWARRPRRRGYVQLYSLHSVGWTGYAVDKRGRVRPEAKQAFSQVLATGDGKRIAIHPRLVALVAKVSDTFGTRPIRVVSGYRIESAAVGSRHRVGRAIDLVVESVPNTALCDYVRTLDKVGVGYYPNSHFVHLDVREQWTYWIDRSGPGEPPRYVGVWARAQGGQVVGPGSSEPGAAAELDRPARDR